MPLDRCLSVLLKPKYIDFAVKFAAYIKRKFFFKEVWCPEKALYDSVVAQSRSPSFFVELGVPDTPIGRFEVLAMHLFLLMYRFRSDKELFSLARALSQVAVNDLEQDLREMGVGDLSVGLKVKSLMEGLYGRFGVYADGVVSGDDLLERAIERNVFADIDFDSDASKYIAIYLRRVVVSFGSLPSENFLNGDADFGMPPSREEY